MKIRIPEGVIRHLALDQAQESWRAATMLIGQEFQSNNTPIRRAKRIGGIIFSEARQVLSIPATILYRARRGKM